MVHVRSHVPPVWRQIAAFAARQQVNPKMLVRGALAEAGRFRLPPPTDLMSDRVLEYCRKCQDVERKNVAFDLRSDSNLAETEFYGITRGGEKDPSNAWCRVICQRRAPLASCTATVWPAARS